MKIDRSELEHAFEQFAFRGGGVVVGHPGAGKTFTLQRFCSALIDRNYPCLYLPIDKLGIEDVSDIRDALGGQGDVIQYLRDQVKTQTTKPAILVVDAFDAARSEQAQQRILRFIQRIVGELHQHWNIVISVRLYDAKKSTGLQKLFPLSAEQESPSHFQSNDLHCRHFWIPPLTDDEVESAVHHSPVMQSVYDKASPQFKELLRTPFHIWLLEQLTGDTDLLQKLTEINSEIQLLGLFWRERVFQGAGGDARRVLAHRIANALMCRRALTISKDLVFDAASEEAWDSLLSRRVLEEAGKFQERVGFSHNILFDYAVSAELIKGEPNDLEAFLAVDASRCLFLRPSLTYYFARLWHDDPSRFWRTLWALLPSRKAQIRLFSRLLPTAVAVKEAESPAQFDPLLQHRNANREEGDEAVLRFVQALRALDIRKDHIWAPIFLRLSQYPGERFAWDMSTYVHDMLERVSKDTQICKPNEKGLAHVYGHIGRNLLNWLWSTRKTADGKRFDRLGSFWLVPLTCKTFWTDPSASRKCLEPALDLVKESGFPIDYLYRLTDAMEYIWPYDPEFVSRICTTVFQHPETSDEKTSMGTPVLPLTSNRRQDYQMCFYTIKEHLPGFLRAAPAVACRTAIECASLFVLGAHVVPYLKPGTELSDLAGTFPFRGSMAHYIPDGSYIWGESRYLDDPILLIGHITTFLENARDNAALLNTLLDTFRDHVWAAVFWRELLTVGSKHPDVFAEYLFELCIARPIQVGSETVHELGLFIEQASAHFTPAQAEQLENSLLSLPGDASSKDPALLERRRDRLLGCIPHERLITTEAKGILSELEKRDALPKNNPLARFESRTEPYSEEKWLTDEKKVDLQREANQKLHSFFAPLKKFSSGHFNSKPSAEDIAQLLPELSGGYVAAKGPDDADATMVTALWTHLGECAEVAAKGAQDTTSESFALCRSILLDCARHPDPEPDPEYDSKFTHAVWSPAPRNEAAQGLIWLAVWASDDNDIVEAIESLTEDPVPSVRFLAASELWRLTKNYTDHFWRIIDSRIRTETNLTIQDALCRNFHHVVARYESKVAGLLDIVLQQHIDSDSGDDLRETVVQLVIWLAIVRQNAWAMEKSDSFLESPIVFARALSRATLECLSLITPPELASREDPESCLRARRWIERALDAASQGFRTIASTPATELDEEKQNKARHLYEVIDHVVSRSYFESGVFKAGKNDPRVSDVERGEFYWFVKPLLEKVIAASGGPQGGILFARTAHYFIELLNGMISHDPQGVLHMASQVAQISKAGGYNFDSMAVREVVKLVECILSNYRAEVREGQPLEDLLSLLDVFADVGWPDALRLVWRLDEVFR